MSTSGGSSGGGGGPPYQSGAGTPAAVTPASVGQFYIDTTHGGLYIAQSTTTGDWCGVGGYLVDQANTFYSAGNTSQGGPILEQGISTTDSITMFPGLLEFQSGGATGLEMSSSSVAFNIPFNSGGVAAVSTPTISSGVKFTPNANGDGFLSFYITHAGTLKVTMGPSSGTENTLLNTVNVLADSQFDFWVPAGWSMVVTLASSATISSATFVLV